VSTSAVLAIDDSPWTPRPVSIRESSPARANDAEFVAVCEAEWKLPIPNYNKVPVEIQFRICNLRKTDAVFALFDTFDLVVKRVDGTQVNRVGGRSGTAVTRTVMLKPGGVYCVTRRAELRWSIATKQAELLYHDGTGAIWSYEPLRVGEYTLHFEYSSTPRFAAIQRRVADESFWSGKVSTQPVSFQVTAP